MADRGDLIGCTVMFEMAEKGKVPIVFTLNGKQITQATISKEFDERELLLFPFVSMGHEGVTVSVKVSISFITTYKKHDFYFLYLLIAFGTQAS